MVDALSGTNSCFEGLSEMTLPAGPLAAWYGDDFTGAAAAMEAMTFAGLPAAVFLDPPDAAILARYPGLRGIGIAGTARAEPPAWMKQNLPSVFHALAATGAQVLQYKICSTLDSSPHVGSIGVAMELARDTLCSRFFPILPAAPIMGRWQAFGQLFARAPGGVFRLDRHPVMARHPVTPIDEADVTLHLSRQTGIALGCLTLDQLHGPSPAEALKALQASGVEGVAMDAVSLADIELVGQLIWDLRGPEMLCVASQGLQYALIAHWQAQGWLRPVEMPGSVGQTGPIIVISGSVSPITQRQIQHARMEGFVVVPVNVTALLTEPGAVSAIGATCLRAIGQGRDILLCTAEGPDDPGVVRVRELAERWPGGSSALNRALGKALGDVMMLVLHEARLKRAVISGGDTSGVVARRLGIEALTAIAPTVPGAALCRVHAQDPAMDGLQLALKGGQMGTDDYFSWIRSGGGEKAVLV